MQQFFLVFDLLLLVLCVFFGAGFPGKGPRQWAKQSQAQAKQISHGFRISDFSEIIFGSEKSRFSRFFLGMIYKCSVFDAESDGAKKPGWFQRFA